MSAAPRLVLASGNRGKLREFRELLAGLPVDLCGLDAFPDVALPEEGQAYADNALAKARAVARATGLPALGDDSGLEVEALAGEPGPRSARYGGPGLDDAGRVARLLRALAGLPAERRGARFVCLLALALPDGEEVVVRGTCPGRVLEAPRGGGGFGYDPVFLPEGCERSMAELTPAEKNARSHRARAVHALLPHLRARLAAGGPGGPA